MFTMIHENYNVRDLDRSLAFYREALGLRDEQGLGAGGHREVEHPVGPGARHRHRQAPPPTRCACKRRDKPSPSP